MPFFTSYEVSYSPPALYVDVLGPAHSLRHDETPPPHGRVSVRDLFSDWSLHACYQACSVVCCEVRGWFCNAVGKRASSLVSQLFVWHVTMVYLVRTSVDSWLREALCAVTGALSSPSTNPVRTGVRYPRTSGLRSSRSLTRSTAAGRAAQLIELSLLRLASLAETLRASSSYWARRFQEY